MNNEQLRCGYTTELQAIGHPLSNQWEFRKKLKSADTSLHRSQLLTVNNPSVTCGDTSLCTREAMPQIKTLPSHKGRQCRGTTLVTEKIRHFGLLNGEGRLRLVTQRLFGCPSLP